MAYTCSMDLSVRVKKAGVSGYLRHLYRDVYPDNENYHHTNENINNELTERNISLVYDDASGELVKPESVKDLKEKLFADIKNFEKSGGTIRKDAVYLRPVMMQLGNGFYEDNPNGIIDADGEDNKELDYMYDWACDTWGKENIRGASVHMDEIHPHVVFLVSSIRKDSEGNMTMSQKNIVNGNAHLKSLHKSFRSFMTGKGLDIEMNNSEVSHPHYKDDEYKKLQDSKKALKASANALYQRKLSLDARESDLNAHLGDLSKKELQMSIEYKKRQEELNKREKELDERERELDERDVEQRSQMDQILSDAKMLSSLMSKYQKMIEKDEERKQKALEKIKIDNQKVIDAVYRNGISIPEPHYEWDKDITD